MRINTQKGNMPAIIIIVLLLIAGGIFFFSKNRSGAGDKAIQTGAPTPEKTIPEAAVKTEMVAPSETSVVYDAGGFSPKSVTIKKGGAVIFRNKTGKSASVASNPHPTHTTYPEFDQYKTDQRGKDEFRFVFEKVGTWGYHDHLNPSITGTVIVE